MKKIDIYRKEFHAANRRGDSQAAHAYGTAINRYFGAKQAAKTRKKNASSPFGSLRLKL